MTFVGILAQDLSPYRFIPTNSFFLSHWWQHALTLLSLGWVELVTPHVAFSRFQIETWLYLNS
ncbi:uncharacterized protein PHALS_15396 [Plasmopara halstedii]|uniref:Uncharacterized protein n=1 Tax=Plasmopara halstedii TaxID=4781 RepID=A0A0P1AGB5_PLAHL|nr:uncharacterized protein PHALS_15396 [Plasmopara halstedii]CEG39661.1 hypothetical protein PHALS_15396 [Plasmopara halstedii]|eukprot:XP_024576030.1 hypothetical protein PHALS_15396 [Plasmopara halstedii]